MRTAFLLAWRTLVRGRFVPLLLLAVALVAVFVPGLVRTDGSAAGEREMYVRAVLGGAAVVVSLAVMCAASGHVAREREEHRLALAAVRPASAFRALAGVWLAYLAAAAAALCAIGVFVYARVPGGAVPCRHHIAPVMPSPMAAARVALEKYLADPSTPEAVRKAPRGVVLALLASKESDRYDPIPPKASVQWRFPAELSATTNLSLRVRFATQFEMRAPLCGEFAFGASCAVLSNNTQAVLEVPLSMAACKDRPSMPRNGDSKTSGGKEGGDLATAVFTNTGAETVMLRPRRDIFLLAPADSFAANLLRALAQTLAGIALAAAFGLFLSSAVSRPVAVFTALVLAMVIFMAPSVIEQFPDELDAPAGDRLGLALTRAVYSLTAPLSEATPIADVAEDRCIEWAPFMRAVLINGVVMPVAFLLAAAFVMRRKTLPDRV